MSGMLFEQPGPRGRRLQRAVSIGTAGLFILAAWWVLRTLQGNGTLDSANWKPFVESEIWSAYLIPGLKGTLTAAGISIVLAVFFGTIFGLGRLSHYRTIRIASGVVVEFFRSVPVLLMMIFAYYILSQYKLIQSEYLSLTAVILGLVPYNGAIVAELLRSGVTSLPSGQKEAGLAVGLSTGQTLRSILLPQAFTAMLPAIVGQLVVLLKDTALGYTISHEELLRKVDQIAAYKGSYLPALIVVAIIFIIINSALTALAHRLEAWFSRRS